MTIIIFFIAAIINLIPQITKTIAEKMAANAVSRLMRFIWETDISPPPRTEAPGVWYGGTKSPCQNVVSFNSCHKKNLMLYVCMSVCMTSSMPTARVVSFFSVHGSLLSAFNSRS